MDRETSRPRMRGGVRGRAGARMRGGPGGGRARGVCVRGGAGSVAPCVVRTTRVRACCSGRGRGGRQVRPGPSSIDELVICKKEELPEVQGLEVPLHPKRMRMEKPSNPDLPGTSQQCPGSPSPAVIVKVETEQSSAPSSPSSSTRHSYRTECLREENILHYLNNGSDDSDDSDDEEEVKSSIIPRVFQSTMDTPLDTDFDSLKHEMEYFEPAVEENTEQPWGLYHFDWQHFPHSPIPAAARREMFSVENAGPTVTTSDPYDIFTTIWDRPIMDHIAAQTNKYAQEVASQKMQSHNLHPKSHISQWYDTTANELYLLFGIIMAMGLVVRTKMEEYWDTAADIFCTPGFSAHMPIDRFFLLSRCLHFNDNDSMCALNLKYSEARLFKIQPILSHLNKKFQELYIPAQNLSLDESLLMWKGWLDISQLIPNKAAQRGIKSYELCESQTGYLWRFEIHAHKKSPVDCTEDFLSSRVDIQDPLEAFTPSIVLQLVKGLEHKGYTLWMDNFYQSPCLARRLKCLGFDCVGTLRTDRKFVPQALHSLTRANMRRGQTSGLTSGDVDVVVWRDANRVAMISTYHGNGQQTVRGSTKPTIIMDYNIMMGGVDKKDQLLAMFPIERKRTKIWYKKLFRRLLNVSVLNSFIIYKKNEMLCDTKMSHRAFRFNLIRSILEKHSTRRPVLSQAMQNKVDVSHRVNEYPKGASQRLRRQCTQCKRLVHTFCIACNKAVCIGTCFLNLHS